MTLGFRAVRKILWEDWDPIGCGVPADEYDDYVAPVLRILVERAPAEALAAYLRETAAEALLSPVSEAKLAHVVAKLMALNGETQT